MRILLVQPLKNLHEPSGYLRTCYLEPLGLEYLASTLEAKGHEVCIKYGALSLALFNKVVEEFSPDVIGYSVYTYAIDISLELARAAKEHSRQVINVFGGYHPTAMPDIVTDPSIDYVVMGEGELTISELLNAIEEGKPINTIEGIAYSDNGTLQRNINRKRILNLDSIPSPKRLVEFFEKTRQYQIAYPPPSKQKAVAQVTFSRGCSFNCEFCSSKNMWGKEVIWRDPVKVVDEIESLNHWYGTNLIYFPDLTFNTNRKRVEAICSELIKRDLPIYWWGLFRVDNLDSEMLFQLKEAKCVKLSFGVESTSEATINKIKGNPQYDWDKTLEIFEQANNLGLIVKAFMMIGFGWDSIESIETTKQLLIQSPTEFVNSFETPTDLI